MRDGIRRRERSGRRDSGIPMVALLAALVRKKAEREQSVVL